MRLSPEGQFISDILGLSLQSNSSLIEGAFSPVGFINWDKFIPLVTHHGLGGLLFFWIRKLKLEKTIPLDVYRDLGDLSESYTSIWEDHGEILKGILMRFHESEVEVILLKGAQIAHTDYPHFSLRPIEDLDLLVRKSNRSQMVRLMLEMGFNPYETNQTCNKFFIKRILKRHKKWVYQPIFIEVHSNLQTPVRLNRSFRIDMDEFWNFTQERSFAGLPFLQLSPTYNLIYLCAHLGHHYFSRLIWIYDIALHIHRHREEIEWEKLEELCGRMRIRNILYHSLALCQDFFQIPIPEKVLNGLSPSWGERKIGYFLIRKHLQNTEKSRISASIKLSTRDVFMRN